MREIVITYRTGEPRRRVSLSRGALQRLGTVKIQFHKILSEGRSVRYDPDPDDGVLHLSVIVTEDEARRNRAKRTP